MSGSLLTAPRTAAEVGRRPSPDAMKNVKPTTENRSIDAPGRTHWPVSHCQLSVFDWPLTNHLDAQAPGRTLDHPRGRFRREGVQVGQLRLGDVLHLLPRDL